MNHKGNWLGTFLDKLLTYKETAFTVEPDYILPLMYALVLAISMPDSAETSSVLAAV